MSGFVPANVRSIVATDCGSTTTKAILIEKQPDGVYRLVARGEAPTTVEAPFDDVTVGVSNALTELQDLTGKQILDSAGKPMTPSQSDTVGVDLDLSTSSAGWDQAIDAVSALWQQCESRTSPVAKARFVLAAIEHIVGIVGTEGLTNEADSRSLQRAVERIASCAQIDAVYVAAEVLKRI